MPKSEDLSRSLEINAIWTFDTEFPTIFNKSCTYITFKSAVQVSRIHIAVYNTCRLLENNVKYVDANLDAPDNTISDNESSSEMLTSQS